jgi:hypothetical protein
MAAEDVIIDTDELEKYFHALTSQIGPFPSHLENGLSIGVEVFTLSEGLGISTSSLSVIWRHSVRTAYMAAVIAISQQGDRSMAWEAFVGGLLHDIGMLVFLTQQPQVYMAVADLAQCRGQELGAIEENLLGTTHAESGEKFLARWGVSKELLSIVAFHDKPFQIPHPRFCSLTAVFIANWLEGGGMPQDSDGVVSLEGEAYLMRLGLWENLPIWQRWMRDMSPLSV